MITGTQAVKNLLLGELPLEKVGPHLRHSVKRALCSGDPRRLTQVALVVVGELLRRGDLLRVAVEGSTDQAGPASQPAPGLRKRPDSMATETYCLPSCLP